MQICFTHLSVHRGTWSLPRKSRRFRREDLHFLQLAEKIAEKSNCSRRKVGAVIVKRGHVLAAGWNGVWQRYRTCVQAGCPRCSQGGDVGFGYDFCICVHAEQKAVATAARDGVSIVKGSMYVNLRPCLVCLVLAAEAGIQEIVFRGKWIYPNNIERIYERVARRFAAFVCVD